MTHRNTRRTGRLWCAVLSGTALAAAMGPSPLLGQSASPGAPGGDGRGAGAFLAEYYADVILNMGDAMAEWRTAWRNDDMSGTLDSYWDNAQILFPARSPIVGREAVGNFYAGLLPSVGEIQTSMVDFDASGRMAFVSGPFYYEVPQATGTPERIEGSHVTVLIRKGRDWRIRTQVFRADSVFEQPQSTDGTDGEWRPLGSQGSGGAFLADYYADVVTSTGQTMVDWWNSWEGDDAVSTTSAYWEEAQILFPEHSPIIGMGAITRFYEALLPQVGRVHTSMIDFDASGRMAFLAGPYFIEIPRGPGETPDRLEGTHVTVLLRKGRDWKIRTQIFQVTSPDVAIPNTNRN